jgi:hypothetical protein
VLILRKDLQERVRSQISANLLERDARFRLPFDPEPDGRDFMAMDDYEIGEIKLAIKFECSRMNSERAGGRAGLGGLVDDAYFDAELGQPERENQACRSSADDQDLAACHIFLRSR